MDDRISTDDSGGRQSLDKLAWGAAAIGRIINRNKRQTHFLLSEGHIKSARKVGGRWCASPAALLKEFGAA